MARRRAMAAALLAALLLVGCAQSGGQASAASSFPAPVYQPGPVVELGDAPALYRMQLGGVVYPLPCPLAWLLADGWTAPGLTEDSLLPSQYAQLVFEKEGAAFTATVLNTADRELPFAECSLAGIAVGSLSDAGAGAPAWRLPGGFGPGSSEEDLQAAWGPPLPAAEGDVPGTLRYATQSMAFVQVATGPGGQLGGARVQNFSPAVEVLPPTAEMAAYPAPQELPAAWQSFTARYGGDLYTLPAPVQAFLTNGWALMDDATLTVEPGAWVRGVRLQKGNDVLRTNLHNYSGEAQPLASCFVTRLAAQAATPGTMLELPGGVTLQTPPEDLALLYGEATRTEGGGSYTYLMYETDEGLVEATVDNASGILSQLLLERGPDAFPYAG